MMKYINIYAYFEKNLGDDLMVDMLLKRFPRHRFYTERNIKNADFLKNSNFRNKEYYQSQYEKRGEFIDRLLNREKGTYVKNKIAKIEENIACSVLIGGSVFMQSGAVTDDLVRVRMKRNNSYLEHGPLFIIGSNFGAYSTEYFKASFEEHFHKCKGISFRDKASFDMFSHIPHVQYAPDVVFGLEDFPKGKDNSGKILVSVIDLTKKYGIEKYADKYESFLAEFCRYVISRDKTPILMSFCKTEGDEIAIRRVLDKLGKDAEKTETYFYDGDMRGALQKIVDAEFVLASRFHAMVLALQMKKRFFALSYDKKITNVLSDIGSELWCDVTQLDNITPQYALNECTEPLDITDYASKAKKHFDQLAQFLKENYQIKKR